MRPPESTSNGRSPEVPVLEGFGTCPVPIAGHETVQLGHGAGGTMSADLLTRIVLPALSNPYLEKLGDSAVLDFQEGRLAFSTDSYIVDPIFFPGGDIGALAVNGTVNDLSVAGARPLFLSLALILEEGFALADLDRVVEGVKHAADRAGVTVVTGDTKVVNRGKGDKVFINTAGIGVIDTGVQVSSANVRVGDVIIVSGGIAEHGMAILSQREGLRFETPIVSDCSALNSLVAAAMRAAGAGIHSMRDPTRGGLAATLNEFAVASEVEIVIDELSIPVKPPVSGACEFLGLDPLHVANEGKLVLSVDAAAVALVMEALRSDPLGADAKVIGEVVEGTPGLVTMRTGIGGRRIVDTIVGEQLPRIC